MIKTLILGAGSVGEAMAMDLSQDSRFEITVADIKVNPLDRVQRRCNVNVVQTYGNNLAPYIKDYDLILGALPARFGFQALETAIRLKKNYCDVSFMEEDGTSLNNWAKDAGIVAIIDCGFAPGLSNMIAAHISEEYDFCEQIKIYAGGLPIRRDWPYQYKATFSLSDILEEYIRPAKIVRDGKIVIKEALSDLEYIDTSKANIGLLEAFNTDGLRTLTHTLNNVSFMCEKTLRYPGHANLIRILRETGFFSKNKLIVKGGTVRPLDVTTVLLSKKWEFEPNEQDVSLLRVYAKGQKLGEPAESVWNLIDYYDNKNKMRSMSKVTAFPATIVARLMVEGKFKPGVYSPEMLVQNYSDVFNIVLDELKEKGVCIWNE